MKPGAQGEELAAAYLARKGFRLVERNWHAGRRGEIDIIAYDREVLVFVEVKVRGCGSLSRPFQAITGAKRKQLARLATEYLYSRGLYGKADCRFDVIGIETTAGSARLEHIEDAFRL